MGVSDLLEAEEWTQVNLNNYIRFLERFHYQCLCAVLIHAKQIKSAHVLLITYWQIALI